MIDLQASGGAYLRVQGVICTKKQNKTLKPCSFQASKLFMLEFVALKGWACPGVTGHVSRIVSHLELG